MARPNPLDNLTLSEAKQVYQKLMENADNHLLAAELISKGELYGGAVSHCVLSTEETVKATLYYLQSLGIEINKIPEINIFFYDHIARHYFMVFFATIKRIIKPIVEIAMKMKDEIYIPEKEIEFTEEEKILLSKDPKAIQGNFSDLRTMLFWWEEANNQKNGGLYVDFRGNRIYSPSDVSPSMYIRAKTIAKTFRNDIIELIEEIDKYTPEGKKEFVEQFEKNDIARLISSVISVRKENKK